MPYPINLEVDYSEKRSRLTVFFRILLVIPILIVGAIYEIGVFFALIIAWFALLFTGRWPEGLYKFVTGFLHFTARFTSYYFLLTDTYPPFDLGEHSEYPVRLLIGPPQESYSRLKVFFVGIYTIPLVIIAYVIEILLELAAIAAWIVIVITGRQPKGLFDALKFCITYYLRAVAVLMMVTQSYPPFSDAPAVS